VQNACDYSKKDIGMITSFLQSVRQRFMVSCLALLGLLSVSVSALAQTSVWKVSRDGSDVYIGGTIHLLRQQDFPLPAAFLEAYDKADRLFFETDIGGMSDMGLQQRMMMQLTYQDGRNLTTVLNAESLAALNEYLAGTGLPLAMVQGFKPGMLVSMLSVLEFQKLGFSPQGVDAFFYNRAMGDGKPRGELESIDEQIAMLAAMGEGYESEFVLYSNRDFKELPTQMDNMLKAWREGDAPALYAQFVAPMLEQAPDLYDSLLIQRNNRWIPQIEAMFAQDGTEFVLVGAAHLAGEHGVVQQLEARGYSVVQLGQE